MSVVERVPLGRLLRRAPRYGINAAAVTLKPGVSTYIRITDIDDSGRFAPNPRAGVAHPAAADYVLGTGELVFARTGASVGKSYLYDPADGRLVYAGFLINVAPDPNQLDPRFLALFVQTKEYWDWIARTSVRSGQPGVNGREFATLLVPVPDLATQRAIAARVGDVDRLIRSLERQIAKKQAIKQGMMQQLLTGRTRLPGFNQDWAEFRAGDLGTFKGGSGFAPRHQGTASGPIPFFKVSDMNNEGNELFMHRANNYITDAQRRLMAAVLMPAESIVFAKVGAAVFLERKRILTMPSCIDNNMAAYTVDRSRVDVRFMHYFLTAFPMSSLVSTGALPSLNGGQLRSIPISLPVDLDEQRAVAAVLADSDAEIDTLQARLAKARGIKMGMIQELLTGRTLLPIEDAS